MSERRLLALLALLLGIVGALLVLIDLKLPGRDQDFLRWMVEQAVIALFALAALAGSLLVYGTKHRMGGIVNVVAGIALLLVASVVGGVLVVFSGILGLVAASTFT